MSNFICPCPPKKANSHPKSLAMPTHNLLNSFKPSSLPDVHIFLNPNLQGALWHHLSKSPRDSVGFPSFNLKTLFWECWLLSMASRKNLVWKKSPEIHMCAWRQFSYGSKKEKFYISNANRIHLGWMTPALFWILWSNYTHSLVGTFKYLMFPDVHRLLKLNVKGILSKESHSCKNSAELPIFKQNVWFWDTSSEWLPRLT